MTTVNQPLEGSRNELGLLDSGRRRLNGWGPALVSFALAVAYGLYIASADLRGRPGRLPPPGREVRLHLPPVLLRPAEHQPPVHLSPVRRAPVRAMAADVLQRRIGAGGLDDGQRGGARRCARPLRAPRQAVSRPGGDLAPRSGAEPPRSPPQPGPDHHRLRSGQPVRDLPRHVGSAQRAQDREAPTPSRSWPRGSPPRSS